MMREEDLLSVKWFRRGVRLHDNPALHATLQGCGRFAGIYIFDTFYNPVNPESRHSIRYIVQSLEDLDKKLRAFGGRLYVFQGCCMDVFRYLHSEYGLARLCFRKFCEARWQEMDEQIKGLCSDLGIECIQEVPDNLWDPSKVVEANGGTPPLTYEMFTHVIMSLGDPARPRDDVDWTGVKFCEVKAPEKGNIMLFDGVPTLSQLGVANDSECLLKGGETEAFEYMEHRLRLEKAAFRSGIYQPNQTRPNILGPPMSLSAALSWGVISVRLFYWKLRDLYEEVKRGNPPFWIHITGQLIWREYFYTMGHVNPRFDKNAGNPACLPIPWLENEAHADLWKKGMTGYPFIDAAMRQLYREGWIHHTARNAVSMFLTRGCLWLNWEIGAEHFEELLVDFDWSVNAGNYMWVCSAAFERVLNSPKCIDPVLYGKRLEPAGDYIRRYIPELAEFEFEYVHEPWKAPLHIQEAAKCIIGRDYPERIVIHEEVSGRNQRWMVEQRHELVAKMKSMGDHCQPSNEKEIYRFFGLIDEMNEEN